MNRIVPVANADYEASGGTNGGSVPSTNEWVSTKSRYESSRGGTSSSIARVSISRAVKASISSLFGNLFGTRSTNVSSSATISAGVVEHRNGNNATNSAGENETGGAGKNGNNSVDGNESGAGGEESTILDDVGNTAPNTKPDPKPKNGWASLRPRLPSIARSAGRASPGSGITATSKRAGRAHTVDGGGHIILEPRFNAGPMSPAEVAARVSQLTKRFTQVNNEDRESEEESTAGNTAGQSLYRIDTVHTESSTF